MPKNGKSLPTEYQDWRFALESWLSQRREWLLVLPEALRHQFTLSGVTKVAIESCLAIERKEAEERSWLSLIAIVQYRPLSQSIKVALEKCLGAQLH